MTLKCHVFHHKSGTDNIRTLQRMLQIPSSITYRCIKMYSYYTIIPLASSSSNSVSIQT